MKTEKEIYDQLDKASEWTDKGATQFAGMSYEEGVKVALEWVLDMMMDDEEPIESQP
jgi:hypothetical protein